MLQALSLANAPQGAADLRTLYAGPLEPRPRVGRAFRLVWALENAGGEEIRQAKITASGGPGVSLPEGPLAAEHMNLGVPELLTWMVRAEGPATVTLQAEYDGKVLREQVALAVEPAAPTAAEGVLPDPTPAAVEGAAVAAHYHAPPPPQYGPAALDRQLYRRPWLGDYDVSPEVIDWQIKWSLEHGLTAWILDVGDEASSAVLDAFLAARFSSQMRFCLRWTAPVPTPAAADELLLQRFGPVLAQPNYLRVKGKPLVLVAGALRRTNDGWGLSDLRELSDQGALSLAACLPLDAATAALLKQGGYCAGVDLHTDETFPRSATPLEDWQRAAEAGTPHLLSLQPAWREEMTPERLQTLLRIALLRARKTDPSAVPLIVAGDFNGEQALEPRRPDGFRWLKAVAAATGAPPTREWLPDDLGLSSFSRVLPAAPSYWGFDSEESWTSAMGLSVLRIADGLLTGRTDSSEPAIFGGETMLDTRRFKAIVLAMSSSAGTEGRVYWRTSLRKFTRENSLPFKLIADGAVHEYRLEASQAPGWRGYLEGLRIDPANTTGATIALDYVRVVP